MARWPKPKWEACNCCEWMLSAETTASSWAVGSVAGRAAAAAGGRVWAGEVPGCCACRGSVCDRDGGALHAPKKGSGVSVGEGVPRGGTGGA